MPISSTVPEHTPTSTKSPTEKGWEASSCIPPATLDRKFCSAREKASPTTDSTATREVTSMPRQPSTMMAATAHSAPFTKLRRRVWRDASSLERPRARSSTLVSTLIRTRLITMDKTAPKILLAVMFSMLLHRLFTVSSSGVRAVSTAGMGMSPAPFLFVRVLF